MSHRLRNLIVVPCALLGVSGCFLPRDTPLPADEVAELRAQVVELKDEVDDLRGRIRVLDATIANIYRLPQ